jgi:hypothetical protein
MLYRIDICTNCKADCWREGETLQDGRVEFICVYCANVIYTAPPKRESR